MNKMRNIKISKLTLNIGAGKEQTKLEKGIKLLKNIAGVAPVKTYSKKRIPSWGIRPGLPIGCKITLRGKMAKELIVRLFESKNNELKKSQFDGEGNLSFGIPEYIDIPQAKYDPKIGVMGLEACVTLERPGFRIKKRRVKRKKIPKKHRISREEAIDYIKNEFKIKIGDE